MFKMHAGIVLMHAGMVIVHAGKLGWMLAW